MFSLDVGLRAHEDLVPNEFQSPDWPALRSGVGTTSWTSWRSSDSWAGSIPSHCHPQQRAVTFTPLRSASPGLLSRLVQADVAGHGQAVSATAATLRNLLRKHMNTLDQSVLLQEMNEVFCREDDREKVQCATAGVFGNFRKTRDLIFTNAGHLFAL
jgi:Stage II sporulation protein E (SpoIIE)